MKFSKYCFNQPITRKETKVFLLYNKSAIGNLWLQHYIHPLRVFTSVDNITNIDAVNRNYIQSLQDFSVSDQVNQLTILEKNVFDLYENMSLLMDKNKI